MDNIEVRGARTHNLKNINLIIPRDKLIVVTGLSGSGKSSLAFDTLYAEGQRRYVESLSAYARQFLSLMEKPDVDHIEGLSPAISIEQKSTSHNPRSTVGTITEIHDYLRLLFARVGEPRCPDHHVPLAAQTVSQMVDNVLSQPEGKRLMLLAPVVKDRKGEHTKTLENLAAQGYIRARIDGEVCDLSDPPKLELQKKHTIEVVVDRFKVRDDMAQRLAESFDTALELSGGTAVVADMDDEKADELLFSANWNRACFPSTTRPAPARPAMAWACSSSSIRIAWCKTPSCRWPAARSAAGIAATSTISRCCVHWRSTMSSTSKRRSTP
jgi:excinuclease ABC subunit A